MYEYKKQIKSFKDLDVYGKSYSSMLLINKEILPKLPEFEKFNLISQLRRSSQSIPRLIAEGYAKRHQRLGFQKYLIDALGESNETLVSLEQCRDIYNINNDVVKDLIEVYDIISKQLYKLAIAWRKMKTPNT